MSNTSPKAASVAILKSSISHRGGLEKQALRLADAFAARGCHVTIITSGEVTHSLPHSVVSVCPKHRLSVRHLAAFDRGCQQWLEKHPHDVVFGLDRNTRQTHYRAGNGCHRAYLKQRSLTDSWLKRVSFLINPFHRAVLANEKACFEDPNLKTLFVNSQMVADEITSYYRTPKEKLCVVHNGVEWEAYQESFHRWEEKKPALCSEWDLDPEAHQFLFIGQGYSRKGLAFLLDGLAPIKLPWQLNVVGKDREVSKYRKLCDHLGIGSRVFFRGHQDNVIPFYQIADTVCIPSTYDPFPNVAVEALAMGALVVTSRHSGAKEILNADIGAVIDSLRDPDSVTDALNYAMNHPKTAETAAVARESVRHLDFSEQQKKIVDVTLGLTPRSDKKGHRNNRRRVRA